MEVISVILMFVFGNMNDQETQMTQYIPMESLSKCMKEVRLMKKKNTEFVKDAFCGPGIVHIEDGEVIALYNEIPDGAKLVKKDIDAEAFKRWSLRAKAKWDK
tara:strand:+ start:110 stop:418 length:309 start_codon:yes stop_codon:yes gene_type:complete